MSISPPAIPRRLLKQNRPIPASVTCCRRAWCSLGSLLLAVLCAGCAGVSYRDLTSQTDACAKGFRFYDSSPYLLVQTDGKGGLKSELKWLPDQTKLREAKLYQFLASNEVTFELTNGVLMHSDTEGDGTAVPGAFIAALEKVASSAISKAAFLQGPDEKPSGPGTAPRVYLFKIVQNGNKYSLIGAGGFEPDYETTDG